MTGRMQGYARHLAVSVIVALGLGLTAPASAQPSEPPPEGSVPDASPDGSGPAPEAAGADVDASAPAPAPTAVQARTSYDDVARAPTEEQAPGIAVPEAAPASRPLRTTGRVLLFLPRWVFWIAVQPIRGGLWAYERYQLGGLVKSIFFNDEETLGLYPLALFETGFGANFGGRFIYRDLFGEEGRLRLRASYGGRFRQQYSAKASTGTLLGDRVELELEGAFQIFPRSRFFGVGNGDLVDGATIMETVDPLARDTAVKTRFRHDDISVELASVIQLPSSFSLRVAGSYIQRAFDPEAELAAGDFDIFDIYNTAQLTGYDTDLSSIGGEIELTYDTRRGTRFWVSDVNPNTGWKLSGFFGFRQGFGDDPSSYGRYGVDVQRVLDLYDATRTLTLRTYVEGVTGSIDEVPFLELPKLGGPHFLRGYARDRFRDRVSTLASAEYRFLVNKFLAAYAFVDTGRVFKGLDNIELDGFRLGYGGGIQVHSATTFRGRFDVSSSIDGDVFINVTLDPVYDVSSRKESL